jgi:hypothetical protein
MRHHDDDCAACARGADRAGQRIIALGVEIGIGLIEDDQEWIAIQRSRQRDTLRLSG